MTTSYHARHFLTQQQLNQYEEAAATQDSRILEVIRRGHKWGYTAEDLQGLLPPMLLTSIRRSLTNLERKRLIVKTGTVAGRYDRPINQYQVVRER